MSEKQSDAENLALTPEKLTGIKVTKPKENSGGLKAISSALKHTRKYMSAADALKTHFKVNQKGGFDCPGCAWPDPDDDRSSLGEYCENGIKAIAEEAQNKTVGRSFFKKWSIPELAQKSDFELGKMGRLSEPMYLPEGAAHYQPIEWDEAFRVIANELNQLDHPDEAIFYTSGRTSNEAAFLYQLFVRAFGTNNLPDCSNMCHESSGKGLAETLGIGKGSVTLPDLYEAEVILVIGQNPGTNHPRMLSALELCKENGGHIISINPLSEAGLVKFTNPQKPGKVLTGGTRLADLFLPVKINGDVPLLKAILIRLIEESKTQPDVIDQQFIDSKTEGYQSFLRDLSTYDYDQCVIQSGVSKELVEKAVELLKSKQKIIVCWAMGLTQHENAVDNIREVVNLILLKGSIGKRGAGTCPVRGHSNVQGDRTMGIWEAPPQSLLDKIEARYGFKPPQHHGYAVVDAIHAMHEEKAKIFFAMGGNFISATPDTRFTAKALQKCKLTVQVSTKLNRSHLVNGRAALILPCLGRTNIDIKNDQEQFVSVENSMGVVHQSQGVLPPASDQLLSEVEIVVKLAQATLGEQHSINWGQYLESYDHIRDDIEQVIPGFKQYNDRVREPGGFYLPNAARTGKFNTDNGKAKFTINEMPDLSLDENELMMMTIRSHDQYNTTIYGLNDRYRGIYNERRVILMNQADMKDRNLSNGDLVNLYGTYKGEVREARKFVVVQYEIPERCCATYFPEANTLVPIDQMAHTSKTPASKSIKITVTKRENSDS